MLCCYCGNKKKLKKIRIHVAVLSKRNKKKSKGPLHCHVAGTKKVLVDVCLNCSKRFGVL